MSEHIAITLVAATVGFVSAIFFCIGNALNSSKSIMEQASTYWDFNPPLGRALAAQRAQYAVGGLLLLVAFLLQVLAVLASSSMPATLPQCVHSEAYLVLYTFIPVVASGAILSFAIYKTTIRKVLQLEAQRRE